MANYIKQLGRYRATIGGIVDMETKQHIPCDTQIAVILANLSNETAGLTQALKSAYFERCHRCGKWIPKGDHHGFLGEPTCDDCWETVVDEMTSTDNEDYNPKMVEAIAYQLIRYRYTYPGGSVISDERWNGWLRSVPGLDEMNRHWQLTH